MFPNPAQEVQPFVRVPLGQQPAQDKILAQQVRLQRAQPRRVRQPDALEEVGGCFQPGPLRRPFGAPVLVGAEGRQLPRLRISDPRRGEAVQVEAGGQERRICFSVPRHLADALIQAFFLPVQNLVHGPLPVPVGHVLPVHPGVGEKEGVEGTAEAGVGLIQLVQQHLAVRFPRQGVGLALFPLFFGERAHHLHQRRVGKRVQLQKAVAVTAALQFAFVMYVLIELRHPVEPGGVGVRGFAAALHQQEAQGGAAGLLQQPLHGPPQLAGVGLHIVGHQQGTAGPIFQCPAQVVIIRLGQHMAVPAAPLRHPVPQLQRQAALAAAAGTGHGPPAEGETGVGGDEIQQGLQFGIPPGEGGHAAFVMEDIFRRGAQFGKAEGQARIGLRVRLLQKLLQNDPHRVVCAFGVDDGADVQPVQLPQPLVFPLRLAVEDGEVDASGRGAVPQHIHSPVFLQTAAQEQQAAAVQKVRQRLPDGTARRVVPVILRGGEHQRVKVRQRVRDRAVELEEAGALPQLCGLGAQIPAGWAEDGEIPAIPKKIDLFQHLVKVGCQHRAGEEQGQKLDRHALSPGFGHVPVFLQREIADEVAEQIVAAALFFQKSGGLQGLSRPEQTFQLRFVGGIPQQLSQFPQRVVPALVDGRGQAGAHEGEQLISIVADLVEHRPVRPMEGHDLVKSGRHASTCFLFFCCGKAFYQIDYNRRRGTVQGGKVRILDGPRMRRSLAGIFGAAARRAGVGAPYGGGCEWIE